MPNQPWIPVAITTMGDTVLARPTPDELHRCQCPADGGHAPCDNRATQEDLLCDQCRGEHA